MNEVRVEVCEEIDGNRDPAYSVHSTLSRGMLSNRQSSETGECIVSINSPDSDECRDSGSRFWKGGHAGLGSVVDFVWGQKKLCSYHSTLVDLHSYWSMSTA